MTQSKDITYFHEWLGLSENWLKEEDSFDLDFPSKPIKTGTPVAEWVVQTVFGLTLDSDSRNIASILPGYDIRSRDAYDMIKLSLAPTLINGLFYECYATEEGEVRFYKIGGTNSNISTNVLYEISTASLSLTCDNVMVQGYDPPPKRYTGMGGVTRSFNLFTFANDLASTDDVNFQDADIGNYPRYHLFGEHLSPEACPYNFEALIEFGGMPDQLDSDDPAAFKDVGVYNPDTHEKILTYLYKIKVDFYKKGFTDISFTGRTARIITDDSIQNFGELQTKNWTSNDGYTAALCVGTEIRYPDADVGVELPYSDERKFISVKDVYIYGYRLKSIRPYEKFVPDTEGVGGTWERMVGTDFTAILDTMRSEPIGLKEGEYYIIVPVEEGSNKSKIVYACNVADPFLTYFGGTYNEATSPTFKLDAVCFWDRGDGSPGTALKKSVPAEDGSISGYLKDSGDDSTYDTETNYPTGAGLNLLFPTGEGQTGYLVKKIVMIYEWDNPCMVIRDTRPDIMKETVLMEQVHVDFYPMIIQDPPAPVAVNGVLLDDSEVRPDYDPTSTQNWEETAYSRAFTSLESSDIKVTMPFADGAECESISTAIKDIQNHTVEETVYVCEPGAEPVLGQEIDGKIINSIDYSYQDSSQYLISVNAGPKWRGVGSWDSSIYNMKTERIQMEGIVWRVEPDNIKCYVSINRLGVMQCVNGTKYKLEPGDEVSVTIYNNPVSL